MKGEATPMGVYSVIQKQKLHHSNIYSGAPMPYMQRITWSGIAIHAGVLPGYPASHGCIRMPMAFAMKMWNWTRMGARVVVTPGEIMPASFSHPLLVTQKVVPQPAAEPQADAPPAPKSDKASEADTPIEPAISQAKLELRSTVGHAGGAKSIIGEPPAATSLRGQTHTADASGGTAAAKPAIAITDAVSSGGNATPPAESKPDSAPVAADASKPDAKADANPQTAASETEPVAAKRAEATSSGDKPSDAINVEFKSQETVTGDAGKQPGHAVVAVQPGPERGKAVVATPESTEREKSPTEKNPRGKGDDVKKTPPKPDGPKANDKPGEAAKATTGTAPTPPAPDGKKAQTRLPDIAKPA